MSGILFIQGKAGQAARPSLENTQCWLCEPSAAVAARSRAVPCRAGPVSLPFACCSTAQGKASPGRALPEVCFGVMQEHPAFCLRVELLPGFSILFWQLRRVPAVVATDGRVLWYRASHRTSVPRLGFALPPYGE